MRKIRAWLELLRLPNLFTVPGDPLAGLLLGYTVAGQASGFTLSASLTAAGGVILASLLLYAAGLTLNDFIDYREDLASRPGRPLADGRIKRSQALLAGLILTGGALVLTWLAAPRTLAVVGSLIGLIFFYNFLTKGLPWVGVINMGLCRGLNLFLGAAVFTSPFTQPVILGAGLACTLYIMTVSILAKEETRYLPAGFKKYLPGLGSLGLVLFALGWAMVRLLTIPPAAFFTLSASWTLLGFVGLVIFVLKLNYALYRSLQRAALPQLPGIIGAYIRLLVPMQALLCSLAAVYLFFPQPPAVPSSAPGPVSSVASVTDWALVSGTAAPLVLLACYLAAGRLSRLFYSS